MIRKSEIKSYKKIGKNTFEGYVLVGDGYKRLFWNQNGENRNSKYNIEKACS